ncbi:MAG: hypothetical protein LBC37_06530 [Zoogloeaceae bacterium]|nr:hypothetical protein [Zoogloeaceae bacterium]
MATTNVFTGRRAALGALFAVLILMGGAALWWAAYSQGTQTESPASLRKAAEQGDANAQAAALRELQAPVDARVESGQSGGRSTLERC